MANLLCHLHFWTVTALSPSTVLQTGVHSYHNKSPNTGHSSSKLDVKACRKEWCEGRNVRWSLTNRRPVKLRDQLRECEEMLASQRIVFVKWKTLRHLLLVLESGVLILYTVCRQSGDIQSILIDRSLLTRIDAAIDNAILLNNSIMLLYATNNKVSVVYNAATSGTRRSTNPTTCPPTPLTLIQENNRRPVEKISFLDLKLYHANIRGMPDERIKRHIIANNQKDLVAVWWQDEQENGLQWSSLADGESDNVIVFHIKSNSKFEVFARIQTKYNPVCLTFSKLHANLMYCIMSPDDVNYEIHSLECQKTPHYTTDAVITTNGSVTAFAMNKDESLLMLGCENGTIILYDMKKEVFKSSMAFFSPITSLSWHPAGGLVFIVGSHGEIQCIDTSLNNIKFSVCNERNELTPLVELGSYFSIPVLWEHSGWGSDPRQGDGHGGCYDNFVIVFNKGPIVLMRIELGVASKGKLGTLEVLCEQLRCNHYQQARDLLLSSNNSSTEEGMTLLSVFMDHMLLQPLCQEFEDLIESVLSSYSSTDVDINMYARRFFFKLVRHQRFEKAFRLAVDISAADLFMDLHGVAIQYNQLSLAEVCLRKKTETAQSMDVQSLTFTTNGTTKHTSNNEGDLENSATFVNKFNFGYFS